jgi:hypothetical protein
VDVKFHCTNCRTKLKVDARWGGTSLNCPECKTTLTVPQWFGSPGEIHEQADQPSLTVRGGVMAPAITLSPEEMTFLGAKQEVD